MTKVGKLSKAMLLLLAVGAPSGVLTEQFLTEKEGVKYVAYQDGGGVWTICLGHTAGVKRGDTATAAQCSEWAKNEIGEAIDRVSKITPVPLSPAQTASFASFCIYNLGERKCSTNANGTKTKFWSAWMRGDIKSACDAIPQWIYDGGRDCRIASNNCRGQVERREQEADLCKIGL